MKKTIIFSLFFVASCFAVNAQTPNFSEHIAPIIYKNCTGCHRPNGEGIAPWPLSSYEEIQFSAASMLTNIENGNMPPWPADDIPGGYVHERKISDEEIQIFKDWIDAGKPEGDPNLAPSTPTFNSDYFLGEPDLQLKAPVYTSKAEADDEYVCFAIPVGLAEDRWVQGIEIIPGNPELVHHCLVFIDENSRYSTDTLNGDCGGPDGDPSIQLLGEYIPGSDPIQYPNKDDVKFGVKLKAGAQIILAMHYPPNSKGTVDSTKVNLHFYPDSISSGVRRVFADAYLELDSFCIEANSISSFRIARNVGISDSVSIFSFFPHMHLLGKSIRAWAITPIGDNIELGSISNWDFEWQGFYVYKKLKVVPKGSIIYGEAVFDNTSLNSSNPNSPPIQVCEGDKATDEMFIIYAQYLEYNQGDENINLEEILDPEDINTVASLNVAKLDISPNPSNVGNKIKITIPDDETYRLRILSINGTTVTDETISTAIGQYTLSNSLSQGIYLVSLKNDSHQYIAKLVVK